MHNRDCFSKPFRSEHVNESQKLLKSAEKYLFHTFSSIWAKLSLKKLFLIRFHILGLLVNTLTANCKYSRKNRENLPLQIQIKLYKKPYTFSGTFFLIFVSAIYIKFPMFWKKYERHTSNISEVLDSGRCAYLNAFQGLFLKTLWQWTC